MTSTRFAAALLTASVLAGASPAGAIGLTLPDGKSIDAVGEAMGNPAGFVVGYTRIVLSPTVAMTVRARQFTPDGKRAGKELVFDTQAGGLFDPVAIPQGSGSKVTAFWMRPATTGIVARVGDTATGKLEAEKTFLAAATDRPAEANMDVVPLAGGKFALVTYRFELVGTTAYKRVAVTTIGPDLKVIAGPTYVPGPRASYVATGASDFTAVDVAGGGALVAYRNRADGNVYVVPVSATGVPAAAARRINQQTMPIGSGGQQAEAQVEAARLQSGRIVVTWTRIGSTDRDDAFDVQYRVLSANGVPVGKEMRAHASAKEEQVAPEVVALSDGGFALSWINNGGPVEGRPRSYWVRSFGADGKPRAAAKMLFKGERGYEGNVSELTANGQGKLMLVRNFGIAPTTLEGILTAP
ncbi:hypothetical protein [Oharaeibacter diazotrophicus]|uniref:Uncharacterized protein n=1 Tax=Oharaeibacter diazotrophicus TaxID=1920512 RepID=A0A4R6R8W2_9HYPH|nr:hypothetical protein [Oharaeibacter diazotrophicus]TDP82334.1 hypothetical protein EDD54_3601 [Oharaeibacter diazotrophicus]BBE72903.1 hypothetical protein OHA_1_02502 [Pleomorphomonas sp. SM30]GLS76941.1 hypothetical protein GCM10007904_22780 [Oharaeibacter diazotrophicus]